MIPQATEWSEDGAIEATRPSRRPLPHDDDEIASALVRDGYKLRLGVGKLEAIAPVSLLRKKLGATTYRLWATLTTMRNHLCETHPALRNLANAAYMSTTQAAKSMARLREFKLVEDFGFIYRRVPCRCIDRDSCPGHKIYIRNVYGQVQERGALHYVVLVPRETMARLTAAAGHGGKRKGAGRPRTRPVSDAKKSGAPTRKEAKKPMTPRSSNKSKGGAYKDQELVYQKNLKVLPQNKAPLHGASISSTESDGEGVQTKLERFLSSPPSAFSASPLQPKAQPAQASAPTEEPAAPAPAGDGMVFVVDGKPCGLLEALSIEGATCIEFGGGNKGPRQKLTPEDFRAASVLSDQIEVLRVPAPPKIYAEDTETHWLHLLRCAFHAVHEKDMGSRYWRPKRELTLRERDALLAACKALMAHDLSPVAWARFSFLQWHRIGKKSAPTPSWVWNAARIAKHAGWCRSEVGSVSNGNVFPLSASKTLLARLATLRQRLGWGRPTEVVVSEVLPDEERMQLLRQQAVQIRDGKKEISDRINNGEWMWG